MLGTARCTASLTVPSRCSSSTPAPTRQTLSLSRASDRQHVQLRSHQTENAPTRGGGYRSWMTIPHVCVILGFTADAVTRARLRKSAWTTASPTTQKRHMLTAGQMLALQLTGAGATVTIKLQTQPVIAQHDQHLPLTSRLVATCRHLHEFRWAAPVWGARATRYGVTLDVARSSLRGFPPQQAQQLA